MEELFFVPLQSIMINRGGLVDALDLFTSSGKAVRFTPGEVQAIADDNGGVLDDWLRKPDAAELP